VLVPKAKPGQSPGGASGITATQVKNAVRACGALTGLKLPAKIPGAPTAKAKGKTAPLTTVPGLHQAIETGLHQAIEKFSACMGEHGATYPPTSAADATSSKYLEAAKACLNSTGTPAGPSPSG
jgi:hypothetical protein